METRGVCILVLNDDLTCRNIVAEMLQHCNYQVLHIGGILDVINAIWEAKDKLDLVLTNAHKLESDGTMIVQHIQKKLRLPILLMCPDKTKIVSKGEPFIFAAYVLKGLSKNDVNNLWQLGLEKERDKMVATFEEEAVPRPSISDVAVETNKTCSSIGEATRFNQKKRKHADEDNEEDQRATSKKPRVVWTNDMHQKFIEAIEILGYDKAVPKKIVEVMAIPGLTRENVASHLQKFRGSLKRGQETAITSLSSNTVRNEFNGLTDLPSHSSSRLNSWQRNSTPLPQSSLYLNRNELPLSERKSYTFLGGGLQFSDRFGFDKLQQKYVPKIQLNRNFRIYGDQMRDMLLTTGGRSSSEDSNSKFVGYRLSSDGNLIGFGGKIESLDNDKISRETLVSNPGISGNDQTTSYVQNNMSSDLKSPLMSTSCISQQQPLVASSSHLDEEDASKQETLGIKDSSEKASSTPSSIFAHDQDFTIPPSEEGFDSASLFKNVPEDDVAVQNASTNPSLVFELDQDCSSSPFPEMFQYLDDQVGFDDDLLKGTGSPSHQLDWDEFDTIFKHDD